MGFLGVNMRPEKGLLAKIAFSENRPFFWVQQVLPIALSAVMRQKSQFRRARYVFMQNLFRCKLRLLSLCSVAVPVFLGFLTKKKFCTGLRGF